MKEFTKTAIGPATALASSSTTAVVIDKVADAEFDLAPGDLVGQPIALSGTQTAESVIVRHQEVGNDVTLTLGSTLASQADGATINIPAHMLYKTSDDDPPSLTVWVYEDDTVWKIVGCRGTFDIACGAGGKPVLNVTLFGLFSARADAANPSPTYQSVRPGIWKDGKMSIASAAAAAQQLTIALNNVVPYPGDPNQPEGFGAPLITGRDVQGNVNPFETLIATRDIFGDFRAGTQRSIAAIIQHANAGQAVGLTVPAGKYRDRQPADRDELIALSAPFSAIYEYSDDTSYGDGVFWIAYF
jgi:hypothetical protein